MAKKAKAKKWFAVVNCRCGRINFIGAAPSPDDAPTWSARAQDVLCPDCGNRTSYRPDEIARTPKGPR